MKEKYERLVTREYEIILVQDEFVKSCNDYDQTISLKELRTLIFHNVVTKITNILDKRVNEMER